MGDVGGGFEDDVLVVDPHGGDNRLVHDGVLGDDFSLNQNSRFNSQDFGLRIGDLSFG